jgi:pimeloyl-ACP methyl ester carboxylesterase
VPHTPALERWLSTRLGGACLHPAGDKLALHAIAGWYLPLSKALALAEAAHGDLRRFQATLPLTRPSRRLARVLRTVHRRQLAHETACHAWDLVFFDPAVQSTSDQRLLIDSQRLAAADALGRCRRLFLRLRGRSLPIGFAIDPADRPPARHDDRRQRLEAAYLPEIDPAGIAESRHIDTALGRQHWLRFQSLPGAGAAWARVVTPRGVTNPPTVIYAHPFGSEFDHTRQPWDPVDRLVARGIRVIRPEGPWHGRRRPAGCIAGEPVLGRAPFGLADYLEAHVKELAALIAWAHRTGGNVGLAGTSLGALTAQMLAAAAVDWPDECRPDALLLVSPAASMLDVLDGSLSRALGLPDALVRAGWTRAQLADWSPLLQPGHRHAVAPENTLFLLGESDDVTPYAGGVALAEAWRLPAANIYRRRHGHFLLSLSLFPDDAPLGRLADLLTGQASSRPLRLASAAV